MGPPLYMWSVVGRNVGMRRMTVYQKVMKTHIHLCYVIPSQNSPQTRKLFNTTCKHAVLGGDKDVCTPILIKDHHSKIKSATACTVSEGLEQKHKLISDTGQVVIAAILLCYTI